ncbi:MAG: hybrid sensor histidine kinase/response regulator [Nitrospinae bacterium]|nr:hybrid sensor histidine kinase/response regulator [Nitrospinota bacterium]
MVNLNAEDSSKIITVPPSAPVILAVDDDESNLLMLKRPLTKEGYLLITAMSGPDALEILRSRPVDVVLLDWMMPEMTGLEVLRAIKADPALSLIPVIMVTARSGPEDLKEGLDTGANDYLRKPVDRMELLARVKAALRERRMKLELVDANESLKELNKMKDEFISILSHDLRTPLSIIIGYSHAVISGMMGSADQQATMALDIINKSAKRQLALVDNLLDLARIEAGAMTLEKKPARLGDLLSECVKGVGVVADIKNISLTLEAPEGEPEINLDETKIIQAINNLVANAIKFTPQGGSVTVTYSITGGEAVTRVKDTGPGIAPEDTGKLFEKFTQLKTKATGGEKGAGLGLTIAQKVVELHGGKLWVESQPGEGASFIFSLPLAG